MFSFLLQRRDRNVKQLEYRQYRSRLFKSRFAHSLLSVNGNWIVGIKSNSDENFLSPNFWNEVFVLNRWTLELEKVLTFEYIHVN